MHNIVKESCIHYGKDNNSSWVEIIASNLPRIKHMTILWTKRKNIKDNATILKIEAKIKEMEGTSNVGYTLNERKEQLIGIEVENIRLLRQQEET